MTTYTKILRAGRVEHGYPDRETRVLLGSIPPEVLAEAKELNR
jgi:hypothetical protein